MTFKKKKPLFSQRLFQSLYPNYASVDSSAGASASAAAAAASSAFLASSSAFLA